MDLWLEKARKAAIDYSFHMNLTHMDDAVAAELPRLREMGVQVWVCESLTQRVPWVEFRRRCVEARLSGVYVEGVDSSPSSHEY